MGSHTKFFGTVLAMLAVNSIYMQLQQFSARLQLDPVPSEQSSPEPQSTSGQWGPLQPIAQVVHLLRLADVSFAKVQPQEPAFPSQP